MPPSPQPIYVPGHTPHELKRLITQGQFYNHSTEQLLLQAGILPGMRVLDFGCGVGEVSFLLSKLVGDTGKVVGIDRSEIAIATAISRIHQPEQKNVRFVQGDEGTVSTLSPDLPFDAVVGRLVLMYQKSPVSTVKCLLSALRPGAIIFFEETNIGSGGSCWPPSPVFEKCWTWTQEVCRRANIEMYMGYKLPQTFVKAGLSIPESIFFGHVAASYDSPVYEIVANSIKSLLPMIVQFELATEDEVQIDTLMERLRHEVITQESIMIPAFHVAAWTNYKTQ